MRRMMIAVSLMVVVLTSGCATSQDVKLAQLSGGRPIATVAMAPSEGNSADMDAAVKAALLNQGLTAKPALPAGTRKSSDADMIVSYTDQWRWDLAMYLRWVNIEMYESDTGNLLATARWQNSAFHGFQDYKTVVKGLVDEMMAQIKTRPKATP
jgi:uncharacterized protein (DUF2235 family)